MNKNKSLKEILLSTFMGHAPEWYKILILVFLILNPILLLVTGKFITGWIILAEFILTLALALKCYPLLPGGLIAIESVFMGMVTTNQVYTEVSHNLEVILLLMFMVAGIYFMKDFLSWLFTKILFLTESKIYLSLMFCFAGAFLSAWLDALTVTAVMITVCFSFYNIYNQTSYAKRVPIILLKKDPQSKYKGINLKDEDDENIVPEEEYSKDNELKRAYELRRKLGREDLDNFNGFLRNLLMHGAVGTALGGVSTIVGEPQNLLIGTMMGWSFVDFYVMMAHESIPILFMGLLTVILVEKFNILGYGYKLPNRVRNVLYWNMKEQEYKMTKTDYFKLYVQMIVAIWLIIGLAFHLAAVGLIGLSVIILLTNFTGKSEEHQIGKAFEESLPFTALLVVFFSIVGLIQENHLFKPIIDFALSQNGTNQKYAFFAASGILSAISDNVFVATIYIKEAVLAYHKGLIDMDQLNSLAIAINVGTNIPSVATPNGQAAFLFLLTSAISSRIKLSYLEMIKLALPYTILLTLTSLAFVTIDWFPHHHIESKVMKIETNQNNNSHH